jgi:hypothetical protein
MAWKRIKEAMALLLIGDGIIALLEPKRHTRLWSGGNAAYRSMMRPLKRNPIAAQALGLAMVGVGFWLASRQKAS